MRPGSLPTGLIPQTCIFAPLPLPAPHHQSETQTQTGLPGPRHCLQQSQSGSTLQHRRQPPPTSRIGLVEPEWAGEQRTANGTRTRGLGPKRGGAPGKGCRGRVVAEGGAQEPISSFLPRRSRNLSRRLTGGLPAPPQSLCLSSPSGGACVRLLRHSSHFAFPLRLCKRPRPTTSFRMRDQGRAEDEVDGEAPKLWIPLTLGVSH